MFPLSHGIFVSLCRGISVLLCGGNFVLLSCGILNNGGQILTPLLSFRWRICTPLLWNYCTSFRGIINKNPFVGFQLKFKRKDRDYLTDLELAALENQSLDNPMLQKVRDLFVFSCYTGWPMLTL
jgi:hypothetical protein